MEQFSFSIYNDCVTAGPGRGAEYSVLPVSGSEQRIEKSAEHTAAGVIFLPIKDKTIKNEQQ